MNVEPIPEFESRGDMQNLVELRAFELMTHTARVDNVDVEPAAEWLMQAARVSGSADAYSLAFGAAATALAAHAADRARAALAELDDHPGTRTSTYYAPQLPALVRAALAAGDERLARRLADTIEARYPLVENALCSARAALAEHEGDLSTAAAAHEEAAVRWETLGNLPERAHALLGEGRCLTGVGVSATEPLRQARELFVSIGHKAAAKEAEALLERAGASVPAGS